MHLPSDPRHLRSRPHGLRWHPWFVAALLALLALPNQPALAAAARSIPVILDTDIGDDIDDTWALGLLLRCRELDVKLVVSDYGRPGYRTRLLGKLLQSMGRPDIAIGRGVEVSGVGGEESQAPWLEGYDLGTYPGKVHQDGVQVMIDTIMASPVPVTLIAIGPLPNIAEALTREPRIAQRARFVGMHGSLRVGYGGSTNIAAEWNVKAAPGACQKALSADWDMRITPLDTCGLVQLDGPTFARLREARDPIATVILENYRVWARRRTDLAPKEIEQRSSTLFDCVAIYLAASAGADFCRLEKLPVRVTDDGFTRIADGAKTLTAATAWNDLAGFNQWMVDRLTTPLAHSSTTSQ
ncbi:MAG: nucleoside hydrolase [Verrucomicrobiales bacterium]|nr:nucleoside hydrolase [Verrucomicrobiales bacterium]